MPVISDHAITLRIDDDTWAAFAAMAAGRSETTAELCTYAIEQFMEQAGFVPAWAQAPLNLMVAPALDGDGVSGPKAPA
ncbi:hypothetical protein M9M90_21050 (plasmid) [Phenylobacterium sp. LH3H17]|uniref:hypothetical protein n=1 Tax=Phenylobacterium sp. LH3H17 TaxID=2903901 RepID=UPI0020CA057E|nr:hypothetical protein [Phenylobacterium sp. LH3H17]UTP41715.1 hypothetical protein M9M90_21050 [Phenylobacterium sp. LH3H17]